MIFKMIAVDGVKRLLKAHSLTPNNHNEYTIANSDTWMPLGSQGRHANAYCDVILTDCPQKSRASSRHRQVDYYNKNTCAWLLWHWSSRGQLALCNTLGPTASWVLSSTDRVKISVKQPIQMVWCFYFTLEKQILPLNPLKTILKVGDLSSAIAMLAHGFGALPRVRAIGHCIIGQERDFLWPDWLNWGCGRSKYKFYLNPKTLGKTHGLVCDNTC